MNKLYFKIEASKIKQEKPEEYKKAVASLKQDVRYVMTLERYNATKLRTAAQNRLYWKWLTELGKHTGHLPEDLHFFFREEYLKHIYIRDDKDGYGKMIESLRGVYSGGDKATARWMHEWVINQTSTTDATVSQFKEYLERIEGHAVHELSFSLPHPDDYWEAMGKKQPTKEK